MSRVASANLPLRTVSQLTGLSPDVLRAWEKRYQVVSPRRGPRGSRLYSGDDVAHLRLLAGVVAAGRSIGDVARLDRHELEKIAAEKIEADGGGDEAVGYSSRRAIAEAIRALEEFDAGHLHRLMSDSLVGLGVVRFLDGVATPLLREVGQRWSDGRLSIADEHLVSGVLRGLLSGIIHGRGPNEGQRVLIATPSGERHEFGALIAAMIAAEVGLEVIYVGADTPGADIGDAADRCAARVVVLGLVNAANHERALQEVRKTASKLPITTELWIGGEGAAAVASELDLSSVRLINDLGDFRAEAVRLRAESPQAMRV